MDTTAGGNPTFAERLRLPQSLVRLAAFSGARWLSAASDELEARYRRSRGCRCCLSTSTGARNIGKQRDSVARARQGRTPTESVEGNRQPRRHRHLALARCPAKRGQYQTATARDKYSARSPPLPPHVAQQQDLRRSAASSAFCSLTGRLSLRRHGCECVSAF